MEESPDGKNIAFTAIKVKSDWSDYNPLKWGLFEFNCETQKLQKLDSSVLFFSYSPKGKMIAFDKSVNGNSDIYVLELESGKSVNVINHEAKDRAPSWSPDGEFLVFYSDRSGYEELYITSLQSKDVKQITNGEGQKSYNPIWSPKSDQIVYYVEPEDGMDQIYLTDARCSFQQNLTNDDHNNIYPSWTPNGQIIYTREKGELMLINTDGSKKQQLINGVVGPARVDASGQRLLFSKGDGDLYIYELKTGVEFIIISGKKIFEE